MCYLAPMLNLRNLPFIALFAALPVWADIYKHVDANGNVTFTNTPTKGAQRVLIVDCDVHQGNGTASILRGDNSIFTFSIHGARNFPFEKETSDLDIELPDGCNDDAYLLQLDHGLDTAFDLARPDLVIYLAGADPYHDDRLGRLALSFNGLAERDRRVFGRCKSLGLPVAVAMAGGYARQIDDTVAIHATTIRLAGQILG